jgi:hypothetical protein
MENPPLAKNEIQAKAGKGFLCQIEAETLYYVKANKSLFI